MIGFIGFWLMVMALAFIMTMGALAYDVIEAKAALLGLLVAGIFLAMLLTGCYLIG